MKKKGYLFTKVVWIIGAIFMAMMMIGTFIDLGNDINVNSISTCINMCLYMAAYVIGIVYLFKPEKDNFAVYAACIHALAAIMGFLIDICGGSKYAALDMANKVIDLITFILFAVTVMAFSKDHESSIFSKIWWLPSAASMIISLIESIITEINDIHGFDISLVILDVSVALIALLPMFMLTLTVKSKEK